MKGVVFLGERELELRDFPDPAPGPGEVVIAIKGSGMCGSDLHAYRAARGGNAAAALGLGGKGSPVIAGHEPCGEVAALRAGDGRAGASAPRDRPSLLRLRLLQALPHRVRAALHSGWHVVYGFSAHGGNADYLLVPARTLLPLPDGALVRGGRGGRLRHGHGLQALKRLDVSGRDTLAVFGQGPVGLSATLLGVGDGRAGSRRGRLAERRLDWPAAGRGGDDRRDRGRPGAGDPRPHRRRGRRRDDRLHRPRDRPRSGGAGRARLGARLLGRRGGDGDLEREPGRDPRRTSPSTDRGPSAAVGRPSARVRRRARVPLDRLITHRLPARPGRRGVPRIRRRRHRQVRLHGRSGLSPILGAAPSIRPETAGPTEYGRLSLPSLAAPAPGLSREQHDLRPPTPSPNEIAMRGTRWTVDNSRKPPHPDLRLLLLLRGDESSWIVGGWRRACGPSQSCAVEVCRIHHHPLPPDGRVGIPKYPN